MSHVNVILQCALYPSKWIRALLFIQDGHLVLYTEPI